MWSTLPLAWCGRSGCTGSYTPHARCDLCELCGSIQRFNSRKDDKPAMETRMPPPSGRYGPSATPTPTPPSSGPRRLLARFPVVLGAAAGLAVAALALVILLLTHPTPAP